MKEENVMRAIIVTKGGMTPFAKSAVKEMSVRGYRVEYFKDAELLVDITEHKLVPEHVVNVNKIISCDVCTGCACALHGMRVSLCRC
jgi:hypothetical protein